MRSYETTLIDELNRRYQLARQKKRLDTYFYWVSDIERETYVRYVRRLHAGTCVLPKYDDTVFFKGVPLFSPSHPPKQPIQVNP